MCIYRDIGLCVYMCIYRDTCLYIGIYRDICVYI